MFVYNVSWESYIYLLLLYGMQALALDMLREHSEHWMFFEKQLTLRAQLYTAPSNILDQAMTSVKCVSMAVFYEEIVVDILIG